MRVERTRFGSAYEEDSVLGSAHGPEAGARERSHPARVTGDDRGDVPAPEKVEPLPAEQVAAAVELLAEQHGRLDVVVNAAGVGGGGPVHLVDQAEWDRVVDINLKGTFLVCKHALPLLRQRGGGGIVNIASVAALVAQRNNAPYGAAKAAVVGFTRQLALEVGPEIRVNVVAPGRIQTGMTEPIMVARGDGDVRKGAEVFGQGNIQKRVASADELAATVCFLLSDDASFVTGSTLVVDGGETVV